MTIVYSRKCIPAMLLALASLAFVSRAMQRDSEPDSPTDGLDKIITPNIQERAGLNRLSSDERILLYEELQPKMERLKTLSTIWIADHRDEEAARAIGWEPASEALETAGYQLLRAGVITANNTEYLVVNTGFTSYATTDIPWGLNEFNMPESDYWCDPAIFSGIDSVIVKGRKYDFTFSSWKQL